MAEHISLVTNGQPRAGDVEARRMPAQFLRQGLELTGTHVGCDASQCGACTVTIDGRAVKSCTMLAVALTGGGEARYRARAVEKALLAKVRTSESIAAAAARATDGVAVNGDIHTDSEYRAAMATTYTKRAIAAALGRLGRLG